MMRGLFRGIAAVAAVGMIAGCGGSDSKSASAGSEPTKEDAKGDVVIGGAMARTGFMAQFDVPATFGAKRAIEEINAKGGLLGRKLKWNDADTKSDKGQAAVAAGELLDGGADVMLVSCDFDFGGPAAAVAQEAGKLIMGCSGSPRFGKQGIGDNAFSLNTLTVGEGAALAEWTYTDRKWKTGYILTDTSIDYSKTVADYFETRWKEVAGAQALVGKDTFVGTDPSISAQITRIRGLAKQPDFIMLASCPPGLATAARQLRAGGIDVPIVSSVCGGNGDSWLKAAPKLENFYSAAYVSTYLDDPNEKVNEFTQAFRETGEDTAQLAIGVVGYSAVEAYAAAVEKAGTFDTAAVRAELEKFKNEPLLIGPTTFTAEIHGDIWRPVAIVEAKGGKNKFFAYHDTEKPPAPKF
jgi:branched-chain amino acid transport system substrate-binding protein